MNPKLRAEAIRYLGDVGLRQYQPRPRMVYMKGYSRLYFPWCSFGKLVYPMSAFGQLLFRHDDPDLPVPPQDCSVVAFFHSRPWKSLDDALDVLAFVPSSFHADARGLVCVGKVAAQEILKGNITPAGAFWMTRGEHSPPLFMKIEDWWQRPTPRGEVGIQPLPESHWEYVLEAIGVYYDNEYGQEYDPARPQPPEVEI